MNPRTLTLFHNPQSRSAGVRVLLEALDAPYDVKLIDLKAGQQRQPEFLALNPLGKLPTLRHGEAIVTEQVAIFLYLADLFPAAGLAPAINDPLRGPYLRWMAFYGACFEPAVTDVAMKREPMDRSNSPYGNFDDVLKTLTDQLERGRYLLGDTLTAADILWASALRWTTGFGLVPKLPVITAYIDEVCEHPAFARAAALDAEAAA